MTNVASKVAYCQSQYLIKTVCSCQVLNIYTNFYGRKSYMSSSEEHMHNLEAMHSQWWIQGGVPPAHPPLRPKIFSISCRFWENVTKSYIGVPLEGQRPLLQGILDLPLLASKETWLKPSWVVSEASELPSNMQFTGPKPELAGC